MKNSLTKTLLCGVMASTFLLANCQKAPSRGVKAGSPGVADQKTGALAKSVACTDDYKKAYTNTRNQQIKIEKQLKDITGESTEEQKANLVTDLEELNRLVKISEPAAIKLNAEACTTTVKGKTETIDFKKIVSYTNFLGTAVAKVTGTDNELSKRAEAALLEKGKESLAEGMDLVVGKDLADALDKDLIKSSYFIGGIRKTTGIEEAKKDASKTVCFIVETAGKVDEGSTLTVLTLAAEVDATTKRKASTFGVTTSAGANLLKCLLAEGKDAAVMVRNAFGANLLSKKQIDAKLPVEEKASVTETEANAKALTETKDVAQAKGAAKVVESSKAASGDTTKAVSGDATKAVSQTGTTTEAQAMEAAKKALAELENSAEAVTPEASEQSGPVELTSSVAKAAAPAVTAKTSAAKAAAITGTAAASADLTAAKVEAKKGFFGRMTDKIKNVYAGKAAVTTEQTGPNYDVMGNVVGF